MLGARDVHEFMAQEDQKSVFHFIVACMRVVLAVAKSADSVCVVPDVDMGVSGLPEAIDTFVSDSD